jgi:pimeloyl-ACP methyl ester carboxylesterase
MVLPGLGLLVGGVLIVLAIIVYRVTHPGPVAEPVNPSHYLLPSLDVTWPTRDGKEIPGWWIPGTKGAPAVLLAPGYNLTRADALSLAAILREQGLNLLIYNSRGAGPSPREASTLGLEETTDMLAALDFLQSRPEVDHKRIGIWGVDVGARAALRAAAGRPDVRAVAADSPYDRVADLLPVRVEEETGVENRILDLGCAWVFRLYRLTSGAALEERLPLEALSDRAILLIQGENRKELARLTAAINERLQPQKEMVSLRSARFHFMSGEELKNYDRQVSNFFVLNLPRPAANQK